MPIVTDKAALWAGVLAAPADAAPKLVLADYLDERGLDPDLARGLRWCAAKGRWPYRSPGAPRGRWVWFVSPANSKSYRPHALPVWLDEKLAGRGKCARWAAATPRELVRRLGRALKIPGAKHV